MRIANEQMSLEIAARGAEMRSVMTAGGEEWLWHGDPAVWGGRSPLLFPVVGRSPGDMVTIAGKAFPMPQHGFACTLDFETEDGSEDWCRLALRSSDATRASFPFAFVLSLTYRLNGMSVITTAKVANLDDASMPFQFGFHPGFRWPLPGAEDSTHIVSLGNGGEPPCYRLDANKLLLREPGPSPFERGRLAPAPSMFEDYALIFPHGTGEAIAFYAESGARLDMTVANLPNFALWQKPGAQFLCLEPWHGMAPFAGAGNRLEDRPHAVNLPPGGTMVFSMRLGFSLV